MAYQRERVCQGMSYNVQIGRFVKVLWERYRRNAGSDEHNLSRPVFR